MNGSNGERLSPLTDEPNFEHFFDVKIQISSCFFLPSIIFLGFLIYRAWSSKSAFYQLKKLSDFSLKTKVRTILAILVCSLYDIGLTLIYDRHLSTADEISNIFLLFFKIVLLIYIIFHIKDQSIKARKTANRHFLFFWVFFAFKCLIELKCEVDSDIFLNVVTLKLSECCCSIYLIYLYINYPTDIIFKDLKKDNVDYELPVINDFSTTDFNSQRQSLIISVLSNHSNRSSVHSNNAPNKKESQNNLPLVEDESKKFPDIKIVLNKKIRYKDDLFEITNSSYEEIINNMFLKIKVLVNKPKKSLKLRRKITDFINLEVSLTNEFSRHKYKAKVIENLPSLTRVDLSGVPKFREQIVCFEMFLNKIVSNKIYITDEVLKFLDLYTEEFSQLFSAERKKFLQKNYSHNNFDFSKLEENPDFKIRESIQNLKNEVNNLKMFNKYKIKKVNVVDIIISENFFQLRHPDNSNCLNIEVKLEIFYDDLVKSVFKTYKEIEHFVGEQDESFYTLIAVPSTEFNKKFFLVNKKQLIKDLNVFFRELINKKISSDSFKTFFKEIYLQEYDLKSNYTGASSSNNYNYTFMKNLYRSKQILSISVDVPTYTLIQNLQFKLQVFYEVNFEIKLKNGSTEKIIQKYKFKEIKEFVNKYNSKNGTKLTLNSKMFFEKLTEKYFFRQNEITSVLKPIFNNPNILSSSFWTEIFLMDEAYRNLKLTESRNATPAHSITESVVSRTNNAITYI